MHRTTCAESVPSFLKAVGFFAVRCIMPFSKRINLIVKRLIIQISQAQCPGDSNLNVHATTINTLKLNLKIFAELQTPYVCQTKRNKITESIELTDRRFSGIFYPPTKEIMYRVTLSILLMSLTLALLLISCDDIRDESEIDSQDVLVPLAIGNEWSYIDSSGSTGEVKLLHIGITGSMMADTGEDEQSEVFFWNWRDLETGEYSDNVWLHYNGEEGFYTLGGISSTDTLLINCLKIKYPVAVSESWIYPDIEYDYINKEWLVTDTLEVFCTAVDTLISTPAGDFMCNEVALCIIGTTPSDVYGQRFYFAPNIGYIGFRLFQQGVIMHERLLVDYILNTGK